MTLVLPHMKRRFEENQNRVGGFQKTILRKMDLYLKPAHITGGAGDEGLPADGKSFPFENQTYPVKQEKKCAKCITSFPLQNYKAAKNKLSKPSKMCSKCGDALCKEHTLFICQKCKALILIKPNPVTDAENLNV